MLKKEEFERWIKASHSMYEIFEGRYDAYPLSVKWIDEWLNTGRFVTKEGDKERVLTLIKNFNYDVYSLKGRQRKKIDEQFKKLAENCLPIAESTNVGFAISPYLFTWNFRRFKQYYQKRKDFSVKLYFKDLGEFIDGEKEKLKGYRDKRLIFARIKKEKIERIFCQVNNELKEIGIGNNEPVGTIKILHILAPYFFPLIDNEIAEAIGLVHSYFVQGRRRKESLAADSYLKWMNALKKWLQHYVDLTETLEEEYESSILKLVDEGLYMMSTVKQQAKVPKLGIEVE